MMLEDKTAVIYGGGGAIGGAVARAFAAAGAHVHLAGRTRARLEAVANDIGDAAEVAELDALDERAVAEHADAVAADAGGIDIALNAVSFPYASGTPLAELAVEEVMHPIDSFLRTNLITAKAVARHMTARRSGAILTLSTAGSRFARPGNLGFGTTCAAIEQMTQRLAAELGPSGVRVVCLRPHAIADAAVQRLLHRRGVRAVGRGVGRQRRADARALGRGPDAAGAPADAGPGGRRGGLPGIGPRGSDHRSGGRPELRQRGAGAPVRTGAHRRARLGVGVTVTMPSTPVAPVRAHPA